MKVPRCCALSHISLPCLQHPHWHVNESLAALLGTVDNDSVAGSGGWQVGDGWVNNVDG